MSRLSRTGAAAASVAQVAAGLAAHVAAAGCLPSLRGLALAVPLSLGGVLLFTHLLRGRALVRLAGGQLVVHAALALAAACTGHVAAHAEPHVAMTAGHVAALVACRAVLDRVVHTVERAADSARLQLRRLTRPIAPPRLSLPAPAPQPPADGPATTPTAALPRPSARPSGCVVPGPARLTPARSPPVDAVGGLPVCRIRSPSCSAVSLCRSPLSAPSCSPVAPRMIKP
ncbi:MAG: hypothetical protein KY451_15310 [Actinobacteria bacterium]|nr:hypothetical protein [Actinomycetota bacterium]